MSVIGQQPRPHPFYGPGAANLASPSAHEWASSYLSEQAGVIEAISKDPTLMGQIIVAARWLQLCFERGGKLLTCGNGGSAADSQHMAAEFTSTLTKDFRRRALPAIALQTDTSFLTAYANDFNFNSALARQVEALGQPQDVLVAFSTSGTSLNIRTALATAASLGLSTIMLTGAGAKAKDETSLAAKLVIAVPSTVTGQIQAAHVAVMHVICGLVEALLFSRDGADRPHMPGNRGT